MLSSSFTMPSPCTAVHFLIGDPPPILLYCSWILGVRRLAMNGANLLEHSEGTRVNTVTPITPTPFPKKTLLEWVFFCGNLPKRQANQHGVACLMLRSVTLPKLAR